MTYADWTNALVVDSAASEHGIENAGELAATVPNQQPKLSWQQRLSGHARVATGPEAGSKAKLNTVLAALRSGRATPVVRGNHHVGRVARDSTAGLIAGSSDPLGDW